jgi:adenine phosphoribosyltransferase
LDTQNIRNLIRTIPDFPKPGIMFRDVTTLLVDPAGFRETIDQLVRRYASAKIDKIVAIESRGFAIGGAIAYHLKCGLVLARKPGKLPADVEREEYTLEYGSDCIEIHRDAVQPRDRCLIVDDLIATGGTAAATVNLVRKLGAQVAGCCFIVNLVELQGTKKLPGVECTWLVEYEGE